MNILWWVTKRRLIATQAFQISAGDNKTLKVLKGTSVYFNGTTVQYGTNKFTCPEIKAAITSGWLVPWYKYRKGIRYQPTKAPIVLTPLEIGKDPSPEADKMDVLLKDI
jgi:hypothetical protein